MRLTGWIDNILPHEKRPGDRLFTRYFTQAADDFVTMSQAVTSELRDFVGPDYPIRYAPHPLYDNYGAAPPMPEARARLGLDAQAPVVLFFGFIRAYKGLDLLLQALADPRVEALGVQALIAGEPYEDWSPYERLIQDGGLANRVRVAQAYIPESEVGLYFAAADLAVQPYKSATQSGITQIAFHYGLPVVVTDVGGLREVVDHGRNGYVVQPQPQAIADAICDFFEKKRHTDMRRAVRESASKYSWENLANALTDR
ncbi:MAG: glycosyltransferase [Saprospiraceae bacterium]